jgi:hypothetical protein
MDTEGMSFEDRMRLWQQRHVEFRAELKEMIARSQRDGKRIRPLLAVAESRDRRWRERNGE